MMPIDLVQLLFKPSLVMAAGFDVAKTSASEPPSLLWDDGTNRLVVVLNEAAIELGDGLIDVTLVVECDEIGRDRIVTTFLTSLPTRPGGFVFASESRPRGPALVVGVWGDALVALCWRTIVAIAMRGAASRGVTPNGQPLMPSTVIATTGGLVVVPQAPHGFMKTGVTR